MYGTIAIVPYGNTARSGVYGTIAIVPYGYRLGRDAEGGVPYKYPGRRALCLQDPTDH
ncbi:MAG: hypothetical protein LBS10_00410 [Gracilibacteraceae bacterium]|nr:hypothetical protein [Gracilibacteraceae bacterium]